LRYHNRAHGERLRLAALDEGAGATELVRKAVTDYLKKRDQRT
jgi:hypothetical protein